MLLLRILGLFFGLLAQGSSLLKYVTVALVVEQTVVVPVPVGVQVASGGGNSV